jgi:Zinc-binding
VFHRADASAFMCEICRQTFMANARAPLLWQHVVAKHPAGTLPTACFPVQLKDFDPDDPKGEKKAATDAAKAAADKKKKADAAKAAEKAGLDDLLNAGLGGKKK